MPQHCFTTYDTGKTRQEIQVRDEHSQMTKKKVEEVEECNQRVQGENKVTQTVTLLFLMLELI